MVDLDQAGQRLRATRLGAPTPVAEIRSRARRRIRARRAVSVTITVTLGVVLVGSFLAARSAAHGPEVKTVPAVPGPAKFSNINPIRNGPHAAGSTRYDYGALRLWLPPGWLGVPASIDCPTTHTVVFGTPPGTCATPGPYLIVRPITGNVPEAQGETSINAWPVVERQLAAAPAPIFDISVPDLDVELTLVGSDGGAGDLGAIVGSLGESTLHSLLDDPMSVVIPTDWRTITYHSITLRVPPSWPTMTTSSTPGPCQPLPAFSRPSVSLSPVNGSGECDSNTPVSATGGEGLALSTGTPTQGLSRGNVIPIPFAPGRTTHRHGVTITIPDGSGQFTPSLLAKITTRTGTVDAIIGLGASPVTAEQILSSIRPAS